MNNPHRWFRINKLTAGLWELIELKDGKETVLYKDKHLIVFSKYQKILSKQPLASLIDPKPTSEIESTKKAKPTRKGGK